MCHSLKYYDISKHAKKNENVYYPKMISSLISLAVLLVAATVIEDDIAICTLNAATLSSQSKDLETTHR